jgi:2-oxoisovalerate dehydrogenase E1 component beta subunit
MSSSSPASLSVAPAPPRLPAELCLKIHDLMLRTRVLEERLITMYKQGDGFFWIGGPGEEALSVPLGLLVDKGQGVDHDYLHLHYRSSGTVLAMGAEPIGSIRQMRNAASDPYSAGRNFAGHFSIRSWNVVPVRSPIETQFAVSIGTARAQRAGTGAKGITIVQGGDAGTAEGDFATALVWSSRKGQELPLLMIVANNRWGISTAYAGQHGYDQIAERGRAFGMPTAVVDGNDPEAAYAALAKAIAYVRTERKPYLLEAMVSRLRGHSSASGANPVKDEVDCLDRFERELAARSLLTRAQADQLRDRYTSPTPPSRCGTSRTPGRSRSTSTCSRPKIWSGRACDVATMIQAIRMALHVGETRLGVTDIFGEDVGPPLGGVFTGTQGLDTAWNTPLDERGIVGTAIGLALAGKRPVAEIQFCDYAFNTIDLLKIAGNTHWASGGDFNVPMVLMTPVGAGIRGSIYHSHSFDATATRIPGWKIVMPSTPRDAYGLLLSAIVDPNPVMFLMPKALLRMKARRGEEIPGEPTDDKVLSSMIDAPLGDRSRWKPTWPELEEMYVPIGEARIAREGTRVTVLTYGRSVPMCLTAADQLAREGIEAEIVDLRSLHPYDWPTIVASVRKTNRVLCVNEDTEITNFGEHLIRRLVEERFYELHAPPRLLAGAHVPGIGLADSLETASVPQVPGIVSAIAELARHEA